MNDDPQYREDPAVVGYDVAAYEAAGVARVEDDECDPFDCSCAAGQCNDPEDDGCECCGAHCSCLSCMYARVA